MKYIIRYTPLLAVAALLTAGCGDMAEPLDDTPAERRAEQQLDFEQGYDFERIRPMVRTLDECDRCQELMILRLEEDSEDEESRTSDKDVRRWRKKWNAAGTIADGNPVPFPVDEDDPNVD